MTEISASSKRTTYVTIIAIVLVLVLGFALRNAFRDVTPIRTAKPTYEDLVTNISTNGKVEPVENYEAHAPGAGIVERVPFSEGASVKAGDLLIAVEATSEAARAAAARAQIATASATAADVNAGGSQEERLNMQADLDRANEQVAQSQKSLDALKALQAKGAASTSEVLAAQSRLQTAQSNVAQLTNRKSGRFSALDRARTQAQLAEGRASLNDAQSALSKSSVRAPFAGVLYSLPFRRYDYVNPGDILLRLANLDQMQVRAYFDEPEIGKLKVGQSVAITWDAKPGKTWHGHVVRVPSTVITYGTRNVGECLIAVDDAHGDLLPNTNVNTRVTTDQKMHVLSIPREGLRTQGSQNYVLRVVNGKLVRTAVTVGGLNMILVEVTSGLSTSDTVALNATTSVDLEPGMSVKPAK